MIIFDRNCRNLIYTDMKAIRFIVAAFLTLSVAASCQPSAEELAKQYKDLTVELAQAKLSGDEEKADDIKKKMEALNAKIERLAKKEVKKAKKDVEKGIDKGVKEVEDALEGILK